MKNLALFLLLCVLILVAYYSEEVFKEEERVKKIAEQSLFKEAAIFTGFKAPNYEIEFQNSWRVKNLSYPASEQLVKEFKTIVSKIVKEGELDIKDEDKFFNEQSIPFSFFVNDVEYKYKLSQTNSVTGKFYIKSLTGEPKIYLCRDDSHFNQAYKSEAEHAVKKYLRLKNIIIGQYDLFIERNLFNPLGIEKVTKIKVDNIRNRWFEVDFENEKTTPKSFKKVEYKNLSQTAITFFQRSYVKRLRLGKQKVLSNPVSTLTLYHDGKETVAKLYKSLNGDYGNFVKFKNLEYVFELEDQAAEIFYSHVQDYWEKKFIMNIDFSKISKFDFDLSYDDKEFYQFEVSDIEKFKMNIKSNKVLDLKRNVMNFVFNLVFNLVDFKEASYVEKSTGEDQSFLLYIKLFKKYFAIGLSPTDIKVLDKKEGLLYTFNYNNDQLAPEALQNVFTLRKN